MNRNLSNAKKAKNDEFYTQLSDIEKELKHYKDHFRGKIVYCNCDDPRESNFFHYFSHNFEKLGLKKLITTCYKSQNTEKHSIEDSNEAICLIYEGDKNGNKVPDINEIGIKKLKGDGDFRSEESIALLKESDIIVTNPPFSLFREYVAQLVAYEKKYLILGSANAITYKEIFPLIKENKMWLGVNNGVKKYRLPQSAEEVSKIEKDEEGNKWQTLGNTYWFTNLETSKRYEDIILYEKYDKDNHPKYDNYDAINVDKTKDIPMDYDGLMGVPITFLDKYNPDQFEIVGSDYEVKMGLLNGIKEKTWNGKFDRGYINGKRIYSRILIKNKNPKK